MGRKSRTGVLKRQREARKAEKAALKREKRGEREPAPPSSGEPQITTLDDLAGYGLVRDEPESDER